MSRLWMIAYDIADHRARRRVERSLLDHAARVQERVFEGRFTHAGLLALKRRLVAELDLATDSLRCYPLCAWCQEELAGQGEGGRRDDADYWVV